MTEAGDSGSSGVPPGPNSWPERDPQASGSGQEAADRGPQGSGSSQGGAGDNSEQMEPGRRDPFDRRQGAPDRRRQPSSGPWQPGSDQWQGAGFNAGPYGTRPGQRAYGPGPGGEYGPGGYGPGQGPGGYAWYGGYSRPIGPPWIVGQVADSVLGLAAGFFFNFVGLLGAVVLMYIWAGNNNGPEDAAERRAHARAVSIWSGLGCALQFGLFLLMFVAIFSLATHAATPGGLP